VWYISANFDELHSRYSEDVMIWPGINKSVFPTLIAISILALAVWLSTDPIQFSAAGAAPEGCANDDSGLKLPAGFCASVFADGLGHARQMVVGSNGVLYVNTWSGEYYGNDKTHEGGFLVALQDKSGAGKADVQERFGETEQTGGKGGTGIGLYKGAIYAEINDKIVKYTLAAGSIVPQGASTIVVSELPLGGDHPMHPFLIDAKGAMYVDVASASNSCQLKNRTLKSPGADPCVELETRGGIWKYDANKTDQKFSKAERFATGIRNGEGFATDASGHLFVTQHGRDQLHTNWPDLYKADEEATLPAEEIMSLKSGGDYGWPFCYYDSFQQKLVLAPEYGGDGGKKVGLCAQKSAPAAAFPAHWAPNALLHYDGKQFPVHYRDGLFVAFHGSWNRAPYPQGGYNVVFQPMNGEKAAGNCEIFADGFAGAVKSPEGAAHRPSGLAVGPDGALYVSDDVKGRIYRIVYRGAGSVGAASGVTPCPSATAPAGEIVTAPAKPPEGTHENVSGGALPEGITPEMVALGNKIYHGQVGDAACVGCHGDTGKGGPLGPDLTDEKWLWGDGSYPAIKKTIAEGVSQPKQYRAPMPAMGGAELTPEQLSAVAAFVWSLSHHQ
jgi:glucose/arabinose dehydrogenase